MKPRAIKGRIVYPKCAKTHLHASVISKILPRLHPDPRYKEKGREGKERGGKKEKGGAEVKQSGTCAVGSFIYFRLCIVLTSGAVLMWPNDFEQKVISGSNC
jgi:hypothetical protein